MALQGEKPSDIKPICKGESMLLITEELKRQGLVCARWGTTDSLSCFHAGAWAARQLLADFYFGLIAESGIT